MIWWWVSGYVFLVQKITKHSGYQKWRYSPYIRLYGYGFFSQGTPTPKVAKASSTCNFWYLSFTNQTPKRFSQVGVVLPYHFPSGRSPTLDSIIKASPSPWVRLGEFPGFFPSFWGLKTWFQIIHKVQKCQSYESDARIFEALTATRVMSENHDGSVTLEHNMFPSWWFLSHPFFHKSAFRQLGWHFIPQMFEVVEDPEEMVGFATKNQYTHWN